jgi:hypothetical protein
MVLLALLATVLAAWPVASIQAADIIDRMMSPGDLSRKHQKYEDNCKNCHVAFNKAAQTTQCRQCHKPIDKQILERTGYHGRDPLARSVACAQCHSEHKGRNNNLAAFDTETFNHAFTDYPLKGGHTRVACASCHKAGEKYAKAPTACSTCHADDDRHKGGLGSNCQSCHVETAWKTVSFDHQKSAFPLTGAHAKVTCQSCHADTRYRGTPKDCFTCHQLDDKHKGSNGRLCQNCHTTVKWSAVSFDHGKQTRFPLTGRHAEIQCNACHKAPGTPKKVEMACVSCHRANDVHKGGNGDKCESCHGTQTWKASSFDHNTKTDFPLRGGHQKVTCKACHTSGVFTRKIETSCISCHAKKDVHKGQLGRNCAQCHNESGWDAKVKFDHGLTRFPLVGLHAAVSCERCHLTATYRDTSRDCVTCHKNDDKHKQTLGPSCGDCHNPNGWRLWEFDHDKETSFALTGKHEGLVCSACHTQKTDRKAKASSTCVSCHRADDKHRGEFGEKCDACHSTTSFSDVRN